MGEKASLNLGKRYWEIVLKGKSCTCTNTKNVLGHALVVWSRVQNSFLLLLYFFNLLLSFFFFLLFLSPPPFFWSIFVLYTTVFTPISPPTCESGVQSFSVPFRPSLNFLLLAVPSTLSYKAAGSLLRHHLHINVARELAGQHLMRR